MTPLEAAARAICQAEFFRRFDGQRLGSADVDRFWKRHIPAARAAIEAIREPSKAMVEAALDEWHRGSVAVWRAMIDALLNDPPAGQARQAPDERHGIGPNPRPTPERPAEPAPGPHPSSASSMD